MGGGGLSRSLSNRCWMFVECHVTTGCHIWNLLDYLQRTVNFPSSLCNNNTEIKFLLHYDGCIKIQQPFHHEISELSIHGWLTVFSARNTTMYVGSAVLTLVLAGTSLGSISEETVENSLSGLISPTLCQLKLICAISKSENSNLRQSVFMKGITTLAQITSGTFIGNTTDALLLRYSLETGKKAEGLGIKRIKVILVMFRISREILWLSSSPMPVFRGWASTSNWRSWYYQRQRWS